MSTFLCVGLVLWVNFQEASIFGKAENFRMSVMLFLSISCLNIRVFGKYLCRSINTLYRLQKPDTELLFGHRLKSCTKLAKPFEVLFVFWHAKNYAILWVSVRYVCNAPNLNAVSSFYVRIIIFTICYIIFDIAWSV